MHIIQTLIGNQDHSGEFFHQKNFENLLYDAVHMLYLAHDIDRESDEHGCESTLVRGSIINSLLLFECAANCCIDLLKLRGSYFDDVDKLPFLSKFEFFLNRVSPALEFDRGCLVVQSVAELKSLRDGYVHPKVKKKQYAASDPGCFAVEFDKTKELGISYDPGQWSHSTAISAIRTVSDFFNLFFLQWCHFDSDTVCGILLDSSPATIPATAAVVIDCVGGLDRAVKDWGVNFKFIGKE